MQEASPSRPSLKHDGPFEDPSTERPVSSSRASSARRCSCDRLRGPVFSLRRRRIHPQEFKEFISTRRMKKRPAAFASSSPTANQRAPPLDSLGLVEGRVHSALHRRVRGEGDTPSSPFPKRRTFFST